MPFSDEEKVVAIETIARDDVRSAVFSALDAIQAEKLMDKKDMIVLLKPNVLMAKPPEEAATTHPAVIRAVIQWVKQFEPSKIYVADSCNGITPGQTVKSMKTSGIRKVCDEEDVLAVGFEETPRQTYRVPEPLVLDEIVSSTLLSEADIIINLPKIKTHGMCTFTCCIKNLFGAVIIGNKSKAHARFPTLDRFSSALADIYSIFRPQLTVVDGYYCQEGKGPASGNVVKLDLILAGYDPVLLDAVACRIIDLDPKRVAHLRKARQKGLGTMDLDRARIRGKSIEEVKHPFRIPRTANFPFPLPQSLTDYMADVIFRATVSFSKDKCVRCGTCWQNCPTKAIEPPADKGEGQTPVWIKPACITCYCCAETCPHDAVDFRINIPRNLLTSWVGPCVLLFLVFLIWLVSRVV